MFQGNLPGKEHRKESTETGKKTKDKENKVNGMEHGGWGKGIYIHIISISIKE